MTAKVSDIHILESLGCTDYLRDDDISQTSSRMAETLLPMKFWGRANTVKTDSGDEKRGGFSVLPPPYNVAQIQAMTLVGNTLWYTTNTGVHRISSGVDTLVATYTTTQSNVSEMIPSSDGRFIFIKNGTQGWVLTISTLGLVQITDPTYVAIPHMNTGNSAAYLDGTFYVLDSNGGIWGCNLINDPRTWDATNVTYANGEPSLPIAMKVYKQYLVVFKQNSTQVFYDASNPQGSPLLPIQSIRIQYGCVAWASVTLVGDSMFWVGRREAGTPVVLEMNGTSIREVSTDSVNKALQFFLESGYSSGALIPPLFNILQGVQVVHQGQPLYVFSLGYLYLTSLVYNLKKQDWTVWQVSAPNVFPLRASTTQPITTNINSWEPLYLTQNTGLCTYSKSSNVESFDLGGGTVYSYPTVSEWISPPLMFDTDRYKVGTRLTVVTTMASSGSIEVCWSDDDMITWSGWQEMDLVDGRHSIHDMGTFRVRYYRIRHSGNHKVTVVKAMLEYLV